MDVIKALLNSKKFIAALVAMAVALSSKFGVEIPEETMNQIIAVLVSFIIGQGMADWGKEAAKHGT